MKLPALARRCLARVESASSGYLDHIGWFRTRAERRAVDSCGNPMPWFTYPAVRFLSDRIRADLRVLEFGAGMGTLWWATHTRMVIAIEHEPVWADEVAKHCTARIMRVSSENPEAYIQAAYDHAPYDIVIVDGIFRNECLAAASNFLSSDGVIILDDAQREEYRTAIDAVRQQGFRLLEFHGPQPVSKHAGCTAIFYRTGNIFGL